MANDNPHSLRLAASLAGHTGDAKELEERYPLSKSASIEKKFQWAKDVCGYLKERFDPETILQIRKDCRCNDGASNANKLLKYLKRAGSIREFVQLFNQNESFASLEYLSDHKILFCYPECYCSCVKRISGQLPKTWCSCTLGNAEAVFRRVFQTEVKATLLESIKSGSERCVIQIEW